MVLMPYMSAITVTDITHRICGSDAKAHLLLRLRHLQRKRKNVCSGQHRFSNDFSGNRAGKPQFSLSSLPYLVKCVQICICCYVTLYLFACFQSVRKRAPLLLPITVWALHLRFRMWLQLIQSGTACRWCCAFLQGLFH